jgi:transcriptional regulator GlxA family with amidase domain
VYDDITLLDFAGVFDPVTRLKTMGFLDNLSWDICARKRLVRSSEGVVLVPGRVNIDLSVYDFLIVPGGDGVKDRMQDKEFLRWITVHTDTTVVAAVCGGSLLLGAAGMLRTKRATTHPQLMSVLQHFAREVVPDRIVDEGMIITAGGVTASIDLGLYLCEKIAGREVREKIQKQMDYRNYPAV